MMGDLPVAVEKVVIDSMDIRGNLTGQLLGDEDKVTHFGRLLMELLVKGKEIKNR